MMRVRGCVFLLLCSFFLFFLSADAQETNQTMSSESAAGAASAVKARNDWFYRGRVVHSRPSAELRRKAYEAKLRLRQQHGAAVLANPNAQGSLSSGSWTALGPVPLASDATGNGTQDYHQVAGRATAVVIDPADATGNTVYIAGAQAGVWKSTNAANATANAVTWTPMTDGQATLSIGALAIQPGNANPANTVILAATGEADNSGDSYFGLGILRSTNAGASWTLISTANEGGLSFSGLGGTRMAFSTASGQTSTVVAAMATTSEGMVDGAITANTTRGLYTSLDAGQTWAYNALTDPGGATDATSATSVVYNAGAGLFVAAVRYHGFYSSPNGVTWTRLANQPGGAVLSAASCPGQSTSNDYGCPIYRGELAVVPGRNEMYAWYVSLSTSGAAVDGGIWQSMNGGATWTSISDSGISNCGDTDGCGVQQGAYNLELLAVANGTTATDLYAGAVNLYKCSINSANLTCTAAPFVNLTHAYGCDPIGAPAHVHPAQHELAAVIPGSGSDSGNALMYFANDGGIYRALDGFNGLTSGACSGTNLFDDLNQNLGSMTQFVTFSEHPTDPNTLLGGAQGNGSPATSEATTSTSWGNVLGGDGAYNAIDPTATSNWYASNPDVPPGGLGIQLCSGGVSCNDSGFSFVVTSGTVGGDDGGFYFPYILDPRSSTAMLVGTCRVWRGPRLGGAFVALSPNFDTLGSGVCTGSEVNQVRALATGGLTDSNGSSVVYATTSGLGPLNGPSETPAGGRVWVTTDATAGASNFADTTENGPQGTINPNQYPISGVAVDSSDTTGNTAYVTVMGFTGGPGHVWKTTSAGASWSDFTGNLPDSPVNAVVVYPPMGEVFVATDVGVFGSSTAAANWTELGPAAGSGQPGFLPNVAVTALGIFASGGQQLLRASTYGRGMWQFNLVVNPDYQLTISNPTQTVFVEQTATFNGTASAVDGYANSVSLSCAAGTNAPPSSCAASPETVTPVTNTPFSVTAGGAAGDYSFNVQGVGSDANHLTHSVPVTLHVISFALTTPTPATVSTGDGTTSAPVSFQVTAAGSFNQSVTVGCTVAMTGGVCNLTPGTTVAPTAGSPVNMTATVTVPSGTAAGSYAVTIQATTAGAPQTATASFTVNVTSNPDFVLSEPTAFPEVKAGSSGTTGAISIASQDGFSGTVTLSCPTTYGAGSCSISPATVSSFPATATLTINGTSFAAGAYSISIKGSSGSTTHTLAVPFSVGDYTITGTASTTATPGGQATASFKLASVFSYSGSITTSCDASPLSGAFCTLSPSSAISLASGGTANLTATVTVPNSATTGTYVIKVNTVDSGGEPSHSASFSITIAPDFTVTSATASQTVTAGQTSGPYSLMIQPVGGPFNNAVTLACTGGMPPGGQCLFSPSGAITPGNTAVDVVMNISTTSRKAAAEGHGGILFAAWMLAPGLGICWCAAGGRWGRRRKLAVIAAIAAPMLVFVSCSGASSGGGGTSPPPQTPITYQITITGSSPGVAADAGQSTVVTLVID